MSIWRFHRRRPKVFSCYDAAFAPATHQSKLILSLKHLLLLPRRAKCRLAESTLQAKLKKKENFVGKEAIQIKKDAGVKRRLVGLRLLGRGVPRSHHQVLFQGEQVGDVTSGTFSPSLNYGVALCSVSSEHAKVGAQWEVLVRDKKIPAEIVKLPFVPSGVKK